MNATFQYWNIDAPVFGRTLSVAQLFLPHALQTQLARLQSLCEQSQPLAVISGEPGTGKSTALRWLSHHLSVDSHDVLLTTVVKRESAPGWLAPRLAEFMGLSTDGMAADAVIRATAGRFDELIAEKRRLVVAVDAAHLLMNPAALEEIAAFLSLQAYAGPCVGFVLCGAPTLLATLAASPDLAGKLALHLPLSALTRDEASAYIAHRLHIAAVAAPFDDDAIDVLHQQTGGILAALNVAADNCLTEAQQKNLRRITADLAKLAVASLSRVDKRASLLAALNEDDKAMSLKALAQAATGSSRAAPAAAQNFNAAPASIPNRSPPPPAPVTPPPPKDSPSIPLQSLFKSDSAKPKP